MRLIDAENLMTVTDICEDGTEITYVPYSEIESAPTAYDVDKVVEQLEEKDSDCEDFGTCNYCQRNWCSRVLIDREDAIEIVKAGGLDER